jgi:hypothetical protein
MDWGVAAKFALIVAALMAAVVFAVFVFDAIWAQIGLIGVATHAAHARSSSAASFTSLTGGLSRRP